MYTQNRSNDTGHFLIMCATSFRKCTERGGCSPEWTASLCIFPAPTLWTSSRPTPYLGVLASLKVLFELGSAPIAWCDREIFEYFAKHNPVLLGGHFTRVELLEVIGLCGFRCYIRLFLPRAIFFGSFVLQDML